jgi:hypothetical protein
MFVFYSAYPTLKVEAICSFETSVDFNGIHGLISQKIELFLSVEIYLPSLYLLSFFKK